MTTTTSTNIHPEADDVISATCVESKGTTWLSIQVGGVEFTIFTDATRIALLGAEITRTALRLIEETDAS